MSGIIKRRCSTFDMIKYSLGECSNSLILNSLFGFAMMYYTDALGLKPFLAGLAMALSTVWDAISDPVMGHISDNTRSRFGRRYLYTSLGGIAMVVIFFFLWWVPDVFLSSNMKLFWYLTVLNILLRTAFTVFFVPYIALGFEICTDYTGRTKLQGIRTSLSMAANLGGPALAWAIFFNNNEVVRATGVAANYIKMGSYFALAAIVFILLVNIFTFKYIKDSRGIKLTGNNLKGFLVDMKEIIIDKYSRWVFGYVFVVMLGIVLVSSFQMYFYEHFMKLSGTAKSICHGGTMVGMGIGALLASPLVRRFDKKKAVYVAVVWSFFCNVLLAALFLPGILKPGQVLSLGEYGFPITFVVFTFFHALYWLGNGIMMPIATSMMADISEIHEIETGVNKDGGYSAMFSLALKLSGAVSTFIFGLCLTVIGFIAGKNMVQTDEFLIRLCAITLLAGPIVSLAALFFMKKYPVNSVFIENLHSQALDGDIGQDN